MYFGRDPYNELVDRTAAAHTGRYRRPRQEDGKLDVWFGKLKYDGPDMCVQSGDNAGGSPTRGFVLGFFCGKHPHSGAPGFKDTFLEEMEARGFDLSTLRFTIRKKVSK